MTLNNSTNKVRNLVVGDTFVAPDGSLEGTFIGRSPHPKYTALCAVVWLMNDGTWFIDALSPDQDVIGRQVGRRDIDDLLLTLAKS